MMSFQRNLLALIALLSWLAVIAQFFISMEASTVDTVTQTVRFFSYFTILTNLMVAVYSTSLWLSPKRSIAVFFAKSTASTAVTLYILLVGLVYNLVLRGIWQPQGMARVVDETLHSIVPLLVLCHWWCIPDKGLLKWKDILGWLIYPFVYLIYTLAHGAISGFYPYPFVDVDALGLSKVLINSFIVGLAVVLMGVILIGIARFKAQKGFK
ncbi:hypothetical protein SAMN05660841_03264 [Sphingobacterium nematocida]|uniref:FAR-17a/AIG1-like protein n=1 Tax=Sphingobacterium nematocida TaxID=1513896 RepID=A0A1T5FHQ0_9SPHI|nr:Pr6Pr family membrane protein [Sphingobacterium nematocida]SKB95685.1 hypothetical protein SAMN05660841_03264 [Sphingobacterium nematocida]